MKRIREVLHLVFVIVADENGEPLVLFSLLHLLLDETGDERRSAQPIAFAEWLLMRTLCRHRKTLERESHGKNSRTLARKITNLAEEFFALVRMNSPPAPIAVYHLFGLQLFAQTGMPLEEGRDYVIEFGGMFA
jgi:hypothetical protein